MASKDDKMAQWWGPRFWWIGLLIGLVATFFILRNFQLTFIEFAIALLGIVATCSMGVKQIGIWIDKKHLSEKTQLKIELRKCRYTIKNIKFIIKQKRRSGSSFGRLRGWLLKKREEASEEAWDKLEEEHKRLDELVCTPTPNTKALSSKRKMVEKIAENEFSQYEKSMVREYVESIGTAVLIALILRAFLIEAFQIPSQSMVPTLRVGDHLFVNKLSYGIRIPLLPLRIGNLRIPAVSFTWSTPEPGDVVVFIEPVDEIEDYIKRVIAVEGDLVEVRNGQVYVNEKLYRQEKAGLFNFTGFHNGEIIGPETARMYDETIDDRKHQLLRFRCRTWELCEREQYGPKRVPAGHVFVMGDNRDKSSDSRVWGFVPKDLLKGRAVFIWWSYREGLVRWDRMFTKIK
jgi:signal peptidase I